MVEWFASDVPRILNSYPIIKSSVQDEGFILLWNEGAVYAGSTKSGIVLGIARHITLKEHEKSFKVTNKADSINCEFESR